MSLVHRKVLLQFVKILFELTLEGNLSCQVQVFPTPHFDYLRKRTTLRFFIVDFLRMAVVQKCTQPQNFRGLPRLTKLTYF